MGKEHVLCWIQKNSGFFKRNFHGWIADNWHVFEQFSAIANAVIASGRSHYSARTIVEVMVHETTVREKTGAFKIGNDRAPDLARAFVVANPEHVDFWEYRRADWQQFKNMFTGA